MATTESTRCVCADDSAVAGGTSVPLHEIAQALSVDDLDRAINAGLLHWNGCVACAIADGLSRPAVEQLITTRDARLSALAARDRYRARQQRSELRDGKRSAASRPSATQSSLPSAAAAALARAKAKAAARTKP